MLFIDVALFATWLSKHALYFTLCNRWMFKFTYAIVAFALLGADGGRANDNVRMITESATAAEQQKNNENGNKIEYIMFPCYLDGTEKHVCVCERDKCYLVAVLLLWLL